MSGHDFSIASSTEASSSRRLGGPSPREPTPRRWTEVASEEPEHLLDRPLVARHLS